MVSRDQAGGPEGTNEVDKSIERRKDEFSDGIGRNHYPLDGRGGTGNGWLTAGDAKARRDAETTDNAVKHGGCLSDARSPRSPLDDFPV